MWGAEDHQFDGHLSLSSLSTIRDGGSVQYLVLVGSAENPGAVEINPQLRLIFLASQNKTAKTNLGVSRVMARSIAALFFLSGRVS
jgi:hypothetical protein